MSYTCTKSVIKILKVKHLDVRNSFMLNTVTLVLSLIEPQKITTNNKTKRPYRKKEKVFVTYVY